MEFGAGKGKFLHFISKAIGPDVRAKFIAIDRENCRFKFDRFHDGSDGHSFERVRMDIEHLVLNQVTAIAPSDRIVVCGKHLCGAATGMLAVPLIHNYRSDPDVPEELH